MLTAMRGYKSPWQIYIFLNFYIKDGSNCARECYLTFDKCELVCPDTMCDTTVLEPEARNLIGKGNLIEILLKSFKKFRWGLIPISLNSLKF